MRRSLQKCLAIVNTSAVTYSAQPNTTCFGNLYPMGSLARNLCRHKSVTLLVLADQINAMRRQFLRCISIYHITLLIIHIVTRPFVSKFCYFLCSTRRHRLSLNLVARLFGEA